MRPPIFNRLFTGIAFLTLVLAITYLALGHRDAGRALATVTVLPAAAPSKRKRGGGNLLVFRQLKQNSDGTYAVLSTGNDSLGDAAGSWHVLGSHEDTGIARDDKGRYSTEVTLIEMDADHRNLVAMVAPVTGQSLIKDPDLTLEDGTQVVNAEVTGDVTIPYFEVWYLDAPIGGKAQGRVMIAQFSLATAWTNKITEWSKQKIKISSVDAQGYTTALPTGITAFSTFTAPVLSAPYQHGKELQGT